MRRTRHNATSRIVVAAGTAMTLAVMGFVSPASGQGHAGLQLDDSGRPVHVQSPGGGQHNVVASDDARTPLGAQSRSIVERLTMLTPAQRSNTRIEIEPLRSASRADREIGEDAAALWNAGEFDTALGRLASLASDVSTAVGISWLEPPEVEGGIAGFGDTTIDTEDGTGSIALDVNKANGVLYCVVQVTDGWNLYRSGNSGVTWTNPYSWFGASGVADVDAAAVDGLVYICYVATGDGSGDLSDLRVRRAAGTTGAIDVAYGFVVAHDSSPATIEEVAAASNTDDVDTNIFFAALESDDTLGYHWDTASDGNSWIEIATGFSNAESGIDMSLNPNGTDYFLHISYIGNDGTVKVARRGLGMWVNNTVEPTYDGTMNQTSISAWEDTVIVGYRDNSTNGMGLRYRISYNGGVTWNFGDIYAPGAGEPGIFQFDVTARGGFGTAAVYVTEVGEPDQLWFSKRDGYSSSGWDAPVQVNESDVLTSTIREAELNWIAAIDGSSNNYRFGIVYPQPDPTFDRRQHCDGDVNESGAVDVTDLLEVITSWGACPGCPPSCNADISPFSGNCIVNVNDLLEVITAWGPCP